jgi:hypothetical protein
MTKNIGLVVTCVLLIKHEHKFLTIGLQKFHTTHPLKSDICFFKHVIKRSYILGTRHFLEVCWIIRNIYLQLNL